MKKVLQIEAVAGMSGDMFVAAALGLLNRNSRYFVIDALYVFLTNYVGRYCADHHDVNLSIEIVEGFFNYHNIVDLIPVQRAGLAANYLELKTDLIYEYMDNEIRVGLEKKRKDSKEKIVCDYDKGTEEASSEQTSHSHDQVLGYSRYKDLDKLFIHGRFPNDRSRELAREILKNLAESEAKVHGIPIYEVHFHELAALDSVIDIVAAAMALAEIELKDKPIDFILSTPPPLGYGYTESDHGIIPLPAPATLELVRGIPVNHTIIPYYQKLMNDVAVQEQVDADIRKKFDHLHHDLDDPDDRAYFSSLDSKSERGIAPSLEAHSKARVNPRLGLELTTPTGAAILKTLVTHFSDLPWDPAGLPGLDLSVRQRLVVEKTSVAAGTMDLPFANICRMSLASIQPLEQNTAKDKNTTRNSNQDTSIEHADTDKAGSDSSSFEQSPDDNLEIWQNDPNQVWQIEASIDDMNPEFYPSLIDQLLSAGARDALLIPVIMKKGRPGHILQVLASEDLLDQIEAVIFTESTSIGLRKWPIDRTSLEQEIKTVDFYGFPIRVKYTYNRERVGYKQLVNIAPEYEDCLAAAKDLKDEMSLKQIYQGVIKLASPI